MKVITSKNRDSNFVHLSDKGKELALEFSQYSKSSTENTLSMCEVLHKAKQELGEYDFQYLCNVVGYDHKSSTIKKYLVIGAYAPRFRGYADKLPNSWTTLYEITHMPPEKFEEAMQKELISVNTVGREIPILLGYEEDHKEITPTIRLILPKHIPRKSLENFINELEAMKIDFEFDIDKKNSAVSAILAGKY